MATDLLQKFKVLREKYKALAAAGGGNIEDIKQDLQKITADMKSGGLLTGNIQAYCTAVEAEIKAYETAQVAQKKIDYWQERNRILTNLEAGALPEDLAKLSGSAFDKKLGELFAKDELDMLFNPQDKFENNDNLKARLLGWDPHELVAFEKENPGKVSANIDQQAIAPVGLYIMEGEKEIQKLKKTPQTRLGNVHDKLLALLVQIESFLIEQAKKVLPVAPFAKHPPQHEQAPQEERKLGMHN